MKGFVFFVLNIFIATTLTAHSNLFPQIRDPSEIPALFPNSIEEMVAFREQSIEQANTILSSYNKYGPIEDFLEQLDTTLGYLQSQQHKALSVFLVNPDKNLREEASKTNLILEKYTADLYKNHHDFYQKLSKGYQKSRFDLDSEQLLLLEQLLHKFELAGHTLSKEKRKAIADLHSEIAELEMQFEKNINEDDTSFYTSSENLKGVKEQVLARFSQNPDGQYKIGCDYPTYSSVMTTCQNERTRKELLSNFYNRAAPANEQVLNLLIARRDQLASLLGYKSYAHLSLSNEMAKEPKVASSFLKNLWKKTLPKEEIEFKALKLNLPNDVTLNSEGKINPWDKAYCSTHYKKKHYNIDNELIAEYFPLESTLDGLISIYESFFDIQIKAVPIEGLWDPEVRLVEIKEKDNTLIGYVLLDLFPREGKYSHACDVPGIASGKISGDESPVIVDLVIANFPQPTQDSPSLLKHRDVITFFHEFGHALHSMFSKNRFYSFTSLNSPFMKYDFVELPSQILEEWMWDSEILKKVSCHYKTKRPLPDHLIQKLVYSKNMASGTLIQFQCYLSFLSLNYFSEGSQKDTTQIARDLRKHLCPNSQELENDHFHLAFGHLTEYGPRYYGYLWSKVFALDMFSKIKAKGLLNPEIGVFYRKTILEKGASVDPNILLKNFLGREPNQDAFIQDLALDKIEREKVLLPM